jgi:hypothetical protein
VTSSRPARAHASACRCRSTERPARRGGPKSQGTREPHENWRFERAARSNPRCECGLRSADQGTASAARWRLPPSIASPSRQAPAAPNAARAPLPPPARGPAQIPTVAWTSQRKDYATKVNASLLPPSPGDARLLPPAGKVGAPESQLCRPLRPGPALSMGHRQPDAPQRGATGESVCRCPIGRRSRRCVRAKNRRSPRAAGMLENPAQIPAGGRLGSF